MLFAVASIEAELIRVDRSEYEALLADREALRSSLREQRVGEPARRLEEETPGPTTTKDAIRLSSTSGGPLAWTSSSPGQFPSDWLPSGAETKANCSVATNDERWLCQMRPESSLHSNGCVSYALCGVTQQMRGELTAKGAPWWEQSVHFIPDGPHPQTRLLVPIQKLAPTSEEEERRASIRPEHIDYKRHRQRHGQHGHRHDTLTDYDAAAAAVAAAPQVWRSWPARGRFEDKSMAWERFPEGETWRSCRTGNKAHW